MAEIAGINLNIEDIVKKAKEADKSLQELAKNGKLAFSQLNSSIKNLTKDGLNHFIQRLDVATRRLDKVQGKSIIFNMNFNSNNTEQSLAKISTAATLAVDAMNKLVLAQRNVSDANKNRAIRNNEAGLSHDLLSERRREAAEYKRLTNEIQEAQRKLNRENLDAANKHKISQQVKRNETQRTVNQLKKQALEQSRLLGVERNFTRAMNMGESSYRSRIAKIERLNTILGELQGKEKTHSNRIGEIRNKITALTKENDRYVASVNKYKNELGGVNKNLNSVSSLARGIRQFTATMFSIAAISSFLNKTVQVRGEFELQHRSLQVLIQDIDMANELWNKTVKLAVESPFKIKELITYTKQLAAYRIEADKLYETNKMLADVSAGLGVDMNRLILAYGQVKAASYLRGTELRQFSEAGIPMLEELSSRFSELEGRVVSVGEVFERISKRMVTFADVDAVFRKVTSEGGTFYQMQEKQAETIRGMTMNLRDSLDLMLNDIGESQESIIKSNLLLAKSLLDNWRALVPVLAAVTSGFAALTISGMAVKGVFTSIFGFFTASPWGIVIAAIAAVTSGLLAAKIIGDKLSSELLKIEKIQERQLFESIKLYKKYVETAKDVTKSTKEQEKAKKDLKERFQEILPDELLEIENITNISKRYKEAEKAMRSYYNAKVVAQKEDKIRSIYEANIETDTIDIIKDYKSFIENNAKSLFKTGDVEYQKKFLLNNVGGMIRSVLYEIENEGGAKNYSEIIKRINEKIGSSMNIGNLFTKIFNSTLGISKGGIGTNARQLYDSYSEMAEALKNVQGFSFETIDEARYAELYNKQDENIKKTKDYFNQLVNLYQTYLEDNKSLSSEAFKTDLSLITSAYESDESTKVFAPILNKFKKELGKSAEGGLFDFRRDFIKKISSDFTKSLSNVYTTSSNTGDDKVVKLVFKNLGENLKEEAKKQIPTDFQNAIITALNFVDKDNVLSQSLLSSLIPDSKTSKSDIVSKIKGIIETYETTVSEVATSRKNLDEDWTKETMYDAFYVDEKELKTMEDSIPVLYKLLELLGVGKKEKTTGGGSEDLISKKLEVIKGLYENYHNLRKDFYEEESLTGAFQKNIDAFASAYGRSDVKTMTAEEFAEKVLNFPDPREIVKFLEELYKTVKDNSDKIKINLAKGDYIYETEKKDKALFDENLIKHIEGLFENYELSLELEKLNIPPDLASQLFGINTLTLPELRAEIESRKMEFIGTEQENKYNEYIKKLTEMEDKQRVESLKKYSKYLVKAQSERLKIKLEELKQIEEIEQLYEDKRISATQKNTMLSGVNEETAKKLSKLEWQEFKSSDMYIQIFEDLDNAATSSLQHIITKLENMRTSLKDLDPSELKEILSALSNARLEIAERNPFKSIAESMKIASEYNINKESWGQQYNESVNQEEILKSQRDNLQQTIEKSREALATARNRAKADGDINVELNEQVVLAKTKLELEEKLLDDTLKMLVAQGKISQDWADKLREGANSVKQIQTSYEKLSSIFNDISNGINSINTGLSSFGEMGALGNILESSSSLFSGMGGISESIGKFTQIGSIKNEEGGLNFGKLANKASLVMGIAGTAASAVSSIINVGKAIHDAQIEKKIQEEIELVEKLGKQYEKLEKRIDEAYSLDTVNMANQNARANLNAQIQSYQRMIQLEEDKKDTDEERIEEWRDNIEDAREQLVELEQRFYEELGGFGSKTSYKDAVGEFIDVWVEAYKSQEDGIESLENKWDEYFDNIIKKQMLMRGAEAIIEPTLKRLDSMLEDGIMSEKEWEDIKKLTDAANKNLNEYLTNMAERYNLSFDSDTSDLSGLQKGIQGVTEETANAIQALLNSIRFFVADSNTQLKTIAGSYNTEDTPNPMLTQLKVIASQTTAIRNLLDSISSPHNKGGRGLKVVI